MPSEERVNMVRDFVALDFVVGRRVRFLFADGTYISGLVRSVHMTTFRIGGQAVQLPAAFDVRGEGEIPVSRVSEIRFDDPSDAAALQKRIDDLYATDLDGELA